MSDHTPDISTRQFPAYNDNGLNKLLQELNGQRDAYGSGHISDDMLLGIFASAKAVIADMQKQINQLQAEMDHIESVVRNVVSVELSSANEPKRAHLVWMAYWKGMDVIPVRTIEKAVGMAIQKMTHREYLKPASVQLTCSCGNKFQHTVHTRGDFNALPQDGNVSCGCPDCVARKKAEQQARLREYEAAEQARKERIQELKHMPYREYLKTPEWQDMRERRLRAARYRCELCHSQGTLHVHHKTYERRGEEYASDLIVLCSNCHAKFHDKLVTA